MFLISFFSCRRLKWKPPSENSVDFKLELRFPPSKTHPDGLDYYSKPTFVLLAWAGGNKYDYFDTLQVSEDEWERYAPNSFPITSG